MEGCFMFQWGGGVGVSFSDGRGSFLSGGASVLVGGFSKKIIRWGWVPPMSPHYGKPWCVCVCVCVCVWFVRKNSLTQRRGALNVNK